VRVSPLLRGEGAALDLVAGVGEQEDVTVGEALGDLVQFIDRDRVARTSTFCRALTDVCPSQAPAPAQELPQQKRRKQGAEFAW
jgi:hypothetical protein